MRHWLSVSAGLIGILAAGAAEGACLPAAPEPAPVRLDQPSERSMSLIVMASVLIQHDSMEPAKLKKLKRTCEVAELRSGDRVYAVSGTGDAALPRLAVSRDRKDPMAFVMPVPDVVGASKANREVSAQPPLGFLLATSDGKMAYGWRAYEALPPDQQLANDVAAVLGGQIRPAFSVEMATKKVNIYVPRAEKSAAPAAP